MKLGSFTFKNKKQNLGSQTLLHDHFVNTFSNDFIKTGFIYRQNYFIICEHIKQINEFLLVTRISRLDLIYAINKINGDVYFVRKRMATYIQMSQFSVKGFFFIYLLIQVVTVKTEIRVIFCYRPGYLECRFCQRSSRLEHFDVCALDGSKGRLHRC